MHLASPFHRPVALLTSGLRALRLRLKRSQIGMAIAQRQADRKQSEWQRAHPGRPFSDYYVHQVRQRLDARRPHPTLGTIGFTEESGDKVEWDGDSFMTRGLDHWSMYLDHAELRPDSKLVDYGCGSLRLGQHAIAFLDRGHYCGLDVTPDFIADGLSILGEEAVREKQPRLAVIDDVTVAEAAAWGPDVIISNAVLQHVPEAEMATYFGRIIAMMKPGSRALVQFLHSDRVRRVKAMSWGHPDHYLADRIAAIDPTLTTRFIDCANNRRSLRRSPRRLLVIERPA